MAGNGTFPLRYRRIDRSGMKDCVDAPHNALRRILLFVVLLAGVGVPLHAQAQERCAIVYSLEQGKSHRANSGSQVEWPIRSGSRQLVFLFNPDPRHIPNATIPDPQISNIKNSNSNIIKIHDHPSPIIKIAETIKPGKSTLTFKSKQAICPEYTLHINVVVDKKPTVGDTYTAVRPDSKNNRITLDINGYEILGVELASPPSHGNAQIADNAITYTPNQGYNGRDSFTYVAKNEKGKSEAATANIIIGASTAERTLYAGKIPPKLGDFDVEPRDRSLYLDLSTWTYSEWRNGGWHEVETPAWLQDTDAKVIYETIASPVIRTLAGETLIALATNLKYDFSKWDKWGAKTAAVRTIANAIIAGSGISYHRKALAEKSLDNVGVAWMAMQDIDSILTNTTIGNNGKNISAHGKRLDALEEKTSAIQRDGNATSISLDKREAFIVGDRSQIANTFGGHPGDIGSDSVAGINGGLTVKNNLRVNGELDARAFSAETIKANKLRLKSNSLHVGEENNEGIVSYDLSRKRFRFSVNDKNHVEIDSDGGLHLPGDMNASDAVLNGLTGCGDENEFLATDNNGKIYCNSNTLEKALKDVRDAAESMAADAAAEVEDKLKSEFDNLAGTAGGTFGGAISGAISGIVSSQIGKAMPTINAETFSGSNGSCRHGGVRISVESEGETKKAYVCNGAPGRSFMVGNGVPKKDMEPQGDTYLDMNDSTMYTRSGGSGNEDWVPQDSLLERFEARLAALEEQIAELRAGDGGR
ncbi:Ig-like domain-containing protein [uncultured Nitratireductor sp.]|uniref:Ig-like domain-containing protein n=1 Tax=uncultured Nitratireductor sp. TaxID=520953 RepID=UPI0025E78662|nr:Ig-like domain-containing protein [uncultured Nitratireductor sp.]